MTNILIVGYHGFDNSGDEAILLAMKNNIEKLNIPCNITALSYNPKSTEEVYNIHAVQRFNIFKVMSSILKSDVVICGGGTLLQDETSTRSILYYLSIIFLSKLFNKKVMLYGNGIGPINNNFSKVLIKYIVNKVDLITLRDEYSGEELKKLQVTKPEIHITADPVFSLEPVKDSKASQFKSIEGIPDDKKILGVSLRPWPTKENYVDEVAQICDYIAEKYDMNIVIIPMQYSEDIGISRNLQGKLKNNAYVLQEKYTALQVLSILEDFDLVISMRLHTLIFAALQNKLILGIVYDPKVDNYLKLLGMDSLGDVEEGLDYDNMVAVVDHMFENKDEYLQVLEENVSVLKNDAKKNDIYLKKLLESEK